uniref:HMA domain-containing protein n=1 Tax=Davidia involucrata TaxID=16924 RepID=A0A5B6YH36_DAVIN
MAVSDRKKKELSTIGFKKHSKSRLLPRTSLASIESLTVPLVQEVVLSADFQCAECQKRVADIISRMNGGTDSVVVDVLEKKVTLTCRYPNIVKVPSQQVATIYKNPLNKIAIIKWLFRSSWS